GNVVRSQTVPKIAPRVYRPKSSSLACPLKLHDLRHLVLASRAFIDALIVTRSVRKDTDQYHSCAAFGTGGTSDDMWRKSGISHFVPPATWLSAALRFSAGGAIIVTHTFR